MTARLPSWDALELAGAPGDAPAAFCADLTPGSLLAAYRRGLFPMPAPDEYTRCLNEALFEDLVAAGVVAVLGVGEGAGPGAGGGGAGDVPYEVPYEVAWWSPDPRPVIGPGRVHLGRRLARRLRNRLDWWTSVDQDFARVVAGCAAGREQHWLTAELGGSLDRLHEEGWAHSVEVWERGEGRPGRPGSADGDGGEGGEGGEAGELIGGAFGVQVGPVLSLDSMFHRRPDASRVALADLSDRFAEAGGLLLDAQWDSPHVRSLGAATITRDQYLSILGCGDGPAALPTALRPARRLASMLSGSADAPVWSGD
ncbi:leucyl/phenylalanyl-tRNA--protein transferase [Kitasatospora azatica]|uniref:leucyl/phenylalanyl-tRNA--protein transferase n=1 Tax=Kitasatospora azatica TaxID=58347 RepID=UPI000690DAB8|nr:hypothetical protein [Kitasatospora azatica]